MSNVENIAMPREINITMDEARALVADRALWPLVRDFLWDFAPQVHESWLEGLGREGESASAHVSRLMSSPRVKRFVLSELGVTPCLHAFPKDDWSRLVLLDGATLESIAKWLGALACADSLRRVTSGATVRELKATLHGIYPEVFGYTMYFKGIDFQRRDAEKQRDYFGNGEVVAQEGTAILLHVLSGLPNQLISRLKLKLPKALCASPSLREAKNSSANVQAALAKLLKLKFPEAYKICCL